LHWFEPERCRRGTAAATTGTGTAIAAVVATADIATGNAYAAA
jgi:hypothetical protein